MTQNRATDLPEFAQRLDTLRRERFRSLSAFAKACGVPLSSMHSYVFAQNDPTRWSLLRIAKACGVSVEWLACGAGEAPEPPKPISLPSPDFEGHVEALIPSIRPVLAAIEAGEPVELWMLYRLKANMEVADHALTRVQAARGKPC